MGNMTINIANDFTTTPGARYIKDGPFSGEEFRQKFLEQYFKNPKDESIIEVILDGTEGYATSFLEEAFGGLARIFGKERCLKKLKLTSIEDGVLIKEIQGYIEKYNG